MTTSVFEPTMAGVMVADPVSLAAMLAAVYGISLGAGALVIGWRWFHVRAVGRSGRGMRVPPEGVTGQIHEGVR
ncbi:MAG: hypothetical protein ACRDTG_26075 [Pseudonocardiaceae bacterium]